jgi:hypothetical protein
MSRGAFFASVGGGAVLAAACNGGSKTATTSTGKAGLVERFAGFAVADEPNANLALIEWPDYVTDEVRPLYEFQLTHGDLMRYMPCYCGCGQTAGHKSNRDCYVQKVNPDGSAVLDSMAPT